MRATFLDVSKAFDKVWLEGLIFKLKNYGVDGNLSKLLVQYLTGRQQTFVLNDQTSPWWNVLAGVPQGFGLGSLLFLIYINDQPNGITYMCKIFVDDTSLSSKVNNKSNSKKMPFNTDPNKQAIEVCFFKKSDKENYPPLLFNSIDVQLADSQKHLGLILNFKLNFNNIESKISKNNKIIGLMQKNYA